MPREELEHRVRELESTVERLESRMATQTQLNHLINRLTDAEIDDYMADPMPNLDHVVEFSEIVADLTAKVNEHEERIQNGATPEESGPQAHWWSVVEYAHEVQDKQTNKLPKTWVAIYKEDVAAATGLSERRGGQLIDQWAGRLGEDGKPGTRFQPYEPAAENNGNASKRKCLKIDLAEWDRP